MTDRDWSLAMTDLPGPQTSVLDPSLSDATEMEVSECSMLIIPVGLFKLIVNIMPFKLFMSCIPYLLCF